jgi:hypothetical protein
LESGANEKKRWGLGLRDLEIIKHWLQNEHSYGLQKRVGGKKQRKILEDIIDLEKNARTSLLWKNITKAAEALNCSISFTLGNENKIWFWFDQWIGQPLRIVYPELFENIINKTSTITKKNI